MAETKIYIPDELDAGLREYAMKRFGYGRGSISKAAEEAISAWIARIGAIEKKLDLVKEAAANDKAVVAVLLFGSYARKELNFRDVDVALLLENGVNGFGVLSRYKNLVGIDSEIDIAILNDMPLNVRSKVLNEATILHVKDKAGLYDYSVDVIRRWSDFEYFYRVALK